MESATYYLRSVSREALRRREGSVALIRTPVPATIPLVRATDNYYNRSHAQSNYVCSGECAEHFGKVLAKYPPQVSSRSAAAMWGCYVHNIVNKRLDKPEFNCENIGDAYDCGCGDEDPKDKGGHAA